MPTTPNLELVHVEQNQDGHAVTVSEAFDDFDGALTALVEIDVSAADVTLTSAQALRNLVFKFTGSPGIARTISVPDGNQKLYVLINNADSEVTLQTVSGSGISVAAGQTEVLYADGTDVVSLASAGAGGIAPHVTVEVFTASGTWTKPSHLFFSEVWVVGGGGGSGGVDNTGSGLQSESGSGGGGGGAYKLIDAASLGATETVTVGAGGAGGTAGDNPGAAGGTSSFGAHCSATGGGGGDGTTGTASANFSDGGAGGAGSGGDLNITATDGNRGRVIEGKGTYQSRGGLGAFFGGGSGNPSGPSNPTAKNGVSYGGGASAAINSANSSLAGGDGFAGVVMVKNYIGVPG